MPDRISYLILKQCQEEHLEPVYDLVKLSTEMGKYQRKRADVLSLHKEGWRDEPLNYKPISLTKVMSGFPLNFVNLIPGLF